MKPTRILFIPPSQSDRCCTTAEEWATRGPAPGALQTSQCGVCQQWALGIQSSPDVVSAAASGTVAEGTGSASAKYFAGEVTPFAG